jgi:hypothetical protein
MNVHGTSENTWSNMEFYVARAPSTRVRALSLPPVGAYAASVSVLRVRDHEDSKRAARYVLNVQYRPRAECAIGATGAVGADRKVRNFYAACDADFNVGPLEEMEEERSAVETEEEERSDGLILYYAGCEIRWVAEHARGTYDVAAHKLRVSMTLEVHNGTGSVGGGRWIPLPEPNGHNGPDGPNGTNGPNGPCGPNRPEKEKETFVYGWHPFAVGVCESRDARVLVAGPQVPTPPFFERIRGSSNVVEHDGALYTVLLVCPTDQRRFHVVARLRRGESERPRGSERPERSERPETNSPWIVEAYTTPFYFVESQREHCTGIDVRDGTMFAFVSQNDADPLVVEIPLGALDFVTLV